MTAGYDPYCYVRQREENDFLWEMSRPKCGCCGEPITDSMATKIGDNFYCEDCVDKAWSVVRKTLDANMKEKLGKFKDWPIVETICEELVEDFDFYLFKMNFEQDVEGEDE